MDAAGSPGSGGSIDLGLDGSAVVVTGAGSGIGAVIPLDGGQVIPHA